MKVIRDFSKFRDATKEKKSDQYIFKENAPGRMISDFIRSFIHSF